MSTDHIKFLQASEKRRKEIVRLHKKDMKGTEIANVLGISRQRVSEILSEERKKGNVR
jgi:DNA-directed RNA polymerase specialized sigma subunit